MALSVGIMTCKHNQKSRSVLSESRSQSDLGFEANLVKAADRFRGNFEPSEYKHVVLGLVFLKYISEAFDIHHAKLAADEFADEEDPEVYFCLKHLSGAAGLALVASAGSGVGWA